MYDFDFIKVNNIEEAIRELEVDDSLLLSGGQTLIPSLKQRLSNPARLISVGQLPDMVGVYFNDNGHLCIKGSTTHFQVSKTITNFHGLSKLVCKIGDAAVRYRGTVGGSLANNDPSACYPAAVLASRGSIITNLRVIPAKEFFLGMFTTALEEKEIIKEVCFELPEISSYVKFEQQSSRFALVGVFVAKFFDEVKVAVTGASENGVFPWLEAERVLSNHFEKSLIDGIKLSTDGLISDVHGSADYRAHLVKTILKRAIDDCK